MRINERRRPLRPHTARARAWDVIRRLGEFTIPELMAQAGIAWKNADDLVKGLQESGHVVRDDCGDDDVPRPYRWRLVRDPGAAFLVPQGGLRAPRSRVWQSMRIRGTFRVGDVAATTGVAVLAVAKYVRALVQGGYVLIVQPQEDGKLGGGAIYQLAKNTGPEAPIPLHCGDIFDPNLNQVVARHQQAPIRARRDRRGRTWATIRERVTFTPAEISEAVGMNPVSTRRYLRALARAGWIHGARVASGDGRVVMYRLVADPGPEAPRLLRDGRVFNPNDGLIWGEAE